MHIPCSVVSSFLPFFCWLKFMANCLSSKLNSSPQPLKSQEHETKALVINGQSSPAHYDSLFSKLYVSQLSGNQCVTEADRRMFQETCNDLLFGEISPSNAMYLFDNDHLRLGGAKRFLDLGMGLGKLAIQAFLTFPNLVMSLELN